MLSENYNDWFHLTAAIEPSEDLDYAYETGKEVWDYKNKRLQELISEIESIPTSLEYYSTSNERLTAVAVKIGVLSILKGEAI